ncbi:MAG: patatin-like phospholipase family protein [Firmicutes bacterium]|nr:patatin-like phospholipase family protein [Bacillota bacterium]
MFPKKTKKVGLVLGAGGARGFCHIGVIEVLRENNIPIDIVTGCSMGAMVAGGLAFGISCEEMREVANRVTNHTVFDIDILNIRKRGGFAKGDRAMKLYKEYVGESLIEDTKIKCAFIATDLKSHSLHVFKTGPLWQAVRASMSIPGVFCPVQHEGMLLVDGAVIKRMPISEARELGADIIIAVDALGPPKQLLSSSTLRILDVSYQMIDWRTAQNEGKDADVLITPNMGNRSSFRFKKNEELIKAGRDATIAALPQILKAIGRKG